MQHFHDDFFWCDVILLLISIIIPFTASSGNRSYGEISSLAETFPHFIIIIMEKTHGTMRLLLGWRRRCLRHPSGNGSSHSSSEIWIVRQGHSHLLHQTALRIRRLYFLRPPRWCRSTAARSFRTRGLAVAVLALVRRNQHGRVLRASLDLQGNNTYHQARSVDSILMEGGVLISSPDSSITFFLTEQAGANEHLKYALGHGLSLVTF